MTPIHQRERDGADLIVAALRSADVEVVFGLPGVHNLALWKAIASSDIRLVTVRHEQAAAYAADGYARSTGRVGVALTTTGPGAANTLGAVGEAWASRSPIVVLATDIPTTLRRPGVYRGALHETTDQAAMFGPVVKSAMKIRFAETAGAVMTAAIAEALSPPSRPVYVEVPTNLLSTPVDPSVPDVSPEPHVSTPESPDTAAVEAAVSILGRSKRPLIWVGGGAVASGAADAISSLALTLTAPVITTYQARGLLGRDHPCAVGVPPHVPAAGRLWDEADVVLAVGTDFDGMMTQNWRMPAPSQLIAVNVDSADASKSYEPDVMITTDAAAGCRAVSDLLVTHASHAAGPPRNADSLRRRLEELRAGVRADLIAEQPDAVNFLEAFDAALPHEAVVFADMCIPGYWLAAFHLVSGPRRFAYPVGWGTLGFAFPAAVGAALGADGPVVSVSGDGGFLFAVGELAVIAQEQVPLTAVIVDDGGYGMLRFDQRHSGDLPFGVDLKTPDFVSLTRSFGIEAQEVQGLGKEFADALAHAVTKRSPSVLVARASLDPPPTTSPRWYRPPLMG